MVSEEMVNRFVPELQDSARAVNLPEVQDMIKRLGRYGLAVALPHMHKDGKMIPLPDDTISFESKLQVSFRQVGDEEAESALPVMWQCGTEVNSVARCSANCGGCC